MAFKSVVSKHGGTFVQAKQFNAVPRLCRRQLQESRFFEAVSATGQGARFVHGRVQEYLCARYIVSLAKSDEPDSLSEAYLAALDRVAARLVFSPALQSVALFLVGLVRHDHVLLASLFEKVVD